MSLEDIKAKVNVRELAEDQSLIIERDGKTYCWHGDERTPSLQLYDDHWFCFRCGEGGDVLDMVMQWKHWSWKRAYAWLAEYAGESRLEPMVRNDPGERDVPDFTDTFAERLVRWGKKHDELVARLWPGVPARNFCHPSDAGLMIPHQMDDGRINGIKLRYFDGSKGAVPGSFFAAALYRPPGSRRQSDVCALCEGESDAWSVTSDGTGKREVLALPCGAGTWRPGWGASIEGRAVLVVMDNDEPGRAAAQRIVSDLHGRARLAFPPPGHKDAREAYAAGWRMDDGGAWRRG